MLNDDVAARRLFFSGGALDRWPDDIIQSEAALSHSAKEAHVTDKLDPLREVGVDVDHLSEPVQSALQELSPEEVAVIAKIQKKAIDAGVGTAAIPAGAGGSGSCIY